MKELLTIQSRLKAPKGQYNSFSKWHYRSAEDILQAVKPLLAETNCAVTLDEDIVLIGTRYYVKATATITNEAGESISTSAFAREEEAKKGMDASQVTGAASSYARKRALGGLFAVDNTKDADALQPVDPPTKEEALAAVNAAANMDALKATATKYGQYFGEDADFLAAGKRRQDELQKGGAV